MDGVIEVSDWARDILRRSQVAAARFNPEVTIRLASGPGGVQAVLSDSAIGSDQVVDLGEMTLYVEAGLEGLIDVEEPHDRIVLRPLGSTPNARGAH